MNIMVTAAYIPEGKKMAENICFVTSNKKVASEKGLAEIEKMISAIHYTDVAKIISLTVEPA